MKMQQVLVREMAPVSLRMACVHKTVPEGLRCGRPYRLYLALGVRGCNRVYHQDVDCRRANELFGYLKPLAVVGLAMNRLLMSTPRLCA